MQLIELKRISLGTPVTEQIFLNPSYIILVREKEDFTKLDLAHFTGAIYVAETPAEILAKINGTEQQPEREKPEQQTEVKPRTYRIEKGDYVQTLIPYNEPFYGIICKKTYLVEDANEQYFYLRTVRGPIAIDQCNTDWSIWKE